MELKIQIQHKIDQLEYAARSMRAKIESPNIDMTNSPEWWQIKTVEARIEELKWVLSILSDNKEIAPPLQKAGLLGAGRIKTWRGEFEILPPKNKIEVGDYYLVDYNNQSHTAAPDKEREVIKVMSTADENGYYRTDRGTQFKSYCIVHRLSPPCT